MPTDKEPRAHARDHRDRRLDEVVHDPYRSQTKPAEPAVCPACGLVYHAGRWQHLPLPANAHQHTCPACRRIRDDMPAGIVTLGGAFATEHATEILNLVRNEEALESAEHPLQRIIAAKQEDGRTVITTTDVHLARRIGEAVAGAFGGKLQFDFGAGEYLIRINWQR